MIMPGHQLIMLSHVQARFITKGTWLKIAVLHDLSYLNWYSSMYMNNPNASHACSLRKRKAVTQGIGQVPEGIIITKTCPRREQQLERNEAEKGKL
jgi:hypothetical protein